MAAERKVLADRQVLAHRCVAGELHLVRWTVASSRKETRWHLFDTSGPMASPSDNGKTLCGFDYPWTAHVAAVETQFEIPEAVLSDLCGVCLLLGIRSSSIRR